VCCTGWAKSKDVQLSEPYKDVFLTALFKALKVERPMLISASMSGSYVMPYLMMPNPETCGERASAFIPLAPVGTPRFTHAQYHRCEVCSFQPSCQEPLKFMSAFFGDVDTLVL